MQHLNPVSCKKLMALPLLMCGLLFVLALGSCQKGIEDPEPDPDEGMWVLTRKAERRVSGPNAGMYYTWNAGYEYLPLEGCIVYRDTLDGVPNDERRYSYDLKGRLKRVQWSKMGVLAEEHTLEYNGDGLPLTLKGTVSLPQSSSYEARFSWTKAGTGWKGEFENDGWLYLGYQVVNKRYELDAKRQLMKLTYLSNGPAVPGMVQEVVRNEKGGVLLEKWIRHYLSGDPDRDSLLYRREEQHPSRISEFQAYLAHGIQWFSDYDNIHLFPRLTVGMEFFDYDRQWPLKVTCFLITMDTGVEVVQQIYEYEFKTTYDKNENPVNLKIFKDGSLDIEVDYTWEKQSWVKPAN
ncbi:MAG: hypothetical protein P0Y53_07025 [Candidatus Pseudobacter hemicellulosilyticus]|uniref:YD repeat-containing protein n=1 Tax=Candidatus Pseudobacter hemicellulosilyticus TaxID=3121375 RepID=A0AAJ6BHI2_9BACT|nr:MAG: hypothetical protein P0Y53_07025 [Pseudobacter sp.]